MPFVSIAQRYKCYQLYKKALERGEIPEWDCVAWDQETDLSSLPFKKSSPRKKSSPKIILTKKKSPSPKKIYITKKKSPSKKKSSQSNSPKSSSPKKRSPTRFNLAVKELNKTKFKY